jgi:ribosomal protein S12 methylthiotransferase
MELLKNKRIALVSLGCSKNMVDSEMILASLLKSGAVLVGDSGEADILVINTCGFIEAAREESVESIVEALDNRPKDQKIVVAGCLSQRFGQELLRELPEIDAILGINAPQEIRKAVVNLLENTNDSPSSPISAPEKCSETTPARFLLTPRHYAYLRIADGCDQACRFCAIPRIRGRQRSRSLKDIVREAEELLEGGCRELCLVAHDLNSYGRDLSGRSLLAELLKELNGLEVDWIRCYYLYPAGVKDDFIRAMAELPRVLPYIDMPLQHISDRMLGAMKRRVSRRDIETLLEKMRRDIENPVFRSTFLLGYPGEKDDDFQELLDFVRQQKFQHLGAFTFSSEEGTAAPYLKNPVPDSLARSRYNELMQVQQEIAFSLQEARLESRVEVICDRVTDVGERICRSWQEGPEGDPVIFAQASSRRVGEIFSLILEARQDYDLLGRE